MSDAPDTKQGIRTFAADFARLKKNAPQKKQPHQPTNKTTTTSHQQSDTAIPQVAKHAVVDSATEDIKQIVAEKTQQKKVTKQPEKIPAFHELQKAVGAIKQDSEVDTQPTEKRSSKNKKGLKAQRRVGGGTVITDTKKVGRPQHPNLFTGISSWLTSFGKKKKAAPKMAIPETRRRKGVIQEATTKTGTIFTADSDTLKERIKERARARAIATDDPETNWSPYTEAGYPLLEAGDVIEQTPVNVNVAFKKHATAHVTVVTPSEPETPTPTEPETPEPVVSTESVVQEPTRKVTLTDTEPVEDDRWVTPAVAKAPTTPTPAEPVAKVPTPADLPEPEPEPEPENIVPTESISAREQSNTGSTNRLAVISAGVIVGLIVITFVGLQLFSYFSSTNAPVPVATNTVIGEQEVLLTVDQSFTAQSLINSVRSGNPGIIEYVLYDTEAELIPADLALDLVTANFPVTVKQFSTSVRFVSIDQTRPQLLMQITDQISVTGALLTQETNLPDSLAPLFGSSGTGVFVDMTINTTDVRVFTNPAGEQSVTYGFINDTTLLIAGSIEEFEALLMIAQ
jgi:hypothetical protein